MHHPFPVCLLAVIAAVAKPAAAEPQNWAGFYADKDFLDGKCVFQMRIEQRGNSIHIAFDAIYRDGYGSGPQGTGLTETTGKGSLEFKWTDNVKNAGIGTITRAGDDLIVSMKATRLTDSHCLVFYKQNIKLKRIGKSRL